MRTGSQHLSFFDGLRLPLSGVSHMCGTDADCGVLQ